MSTNPSDRETPSQRKSDAETVEELKREKLRLEIERLRTPWWRSPANLAPVATILAAMFGLIWAVASGFFDVSRRELILERRELKLETSSLAQQRDRQATEFAREREAQQKQIELLKKEADRLQSHNKELDRPFLTSAGVSTDAFNLPNDSQQITTWVRGANLGQEPGKVIADIGGHCFQDDASPASQRLIVRPVRTELPLQISSWSPTEITIRFAQRSARKEWIDIQRNQPRIATYKKCTLAMRFQVERSDLSRSNRMGISIPQRWLDHLRFR